MKSWRVGLLALVVFSALLPQARAELITNGGFASGFTGWTVVNQGYGDWYLQSGDRSPVSGYLVPALPGGTQAAMTDLGPGAHVLYQDFSVPTGLTNARLSFDRYIGNQNITFSSPGTLDIATAPNQQARVDILTGSSDPFSVRPSDVLLNVLQTKPGDPAFSGYSSATRDLTSLLVAHQGETLRLRFAEVDTEFFFMFGVGNVSLSTTTAMNTPEPNSLTLAGLALLGATSHVWRRLRRGVRVCHGSSTPAASSGR